LDLHDVAFGATGRKYPADARMKGCGWKLTSKVDGCEWPGTVGPMLSGDVGRRM
jgi:hypothetical protein